jgi:hypothetical protein
MHHGPFGENLYAERSCVSRLLPAGLPRMAEARIGLAARSAAMAHSHASAAASRPQVSRAIEYSIGTDPSRGQAAKDRARRTMGTLSSFSGSRIASDDTGWET